jgi:multidrug resistance efflux pump
MLILAACSAAQTGSSSEATVTPVVVSNTVVAEGHLEPLTSTWLSFQASGRVEDVLVKEGDKVKAGQPLIRLEGSDRAEAELTAAQSDLFLAQQNLEDAKKSDAMRSAAELVLANAQRAYNTALSNYYDRNITQGTADQIALYDAKVTMAQDKVDTLQDRLDGMGEVQDSDPGKAKVIADLNQAKIDLDNIKKIRDYYKDLPDSVDVSILKGELDVAKASLNDATRDYNRVKDGPSKESLAQIQTVYDAANAKAEEAQWAYDQLVLTAPYDGTFVQTDLTVGEFVAAGQKVALVADFSQWLIETDDLDENETAEIDPAQPVSVSADALPGKEFTGTVDSISQYYTDKNSDILYTAKVRLAGTGAKLRWGMTMQLEFQK